MMLHYYSYDYALAEWPDDGKDPLHEYKDREEFLDWLLSNRTWAEDGGDKVPSETAVIRQFAEGKDTSIDLNGFCFVQTQAGKERAREAFFS